MHLSPTSKLGYLSFNSNRVTSIDWTTGAVIKHTVCIRMLYFGLYC